MKSFLIVLPVVFLMVLSGIESTTQAQNRTITGTVTKAKSGESLPGVNVTVKNNPTTGTSTNANGKYSLQVPTKAKMLIFSFVGFKQKEVTIGNRTVINVELKQSSNQLQNVVVVGYGTQTKKNLTGSVSSVNAEDIENTTSNSIQETLQGRTAGVHITKSSGTLGEGINIQVRGSASISAGNQPLYVVDGVPVTSQSLSSTGSPKSNPIASLDKSNIKSISILKDASAAAIYGSRASNGVIIIKTKQGHTGKTKFNASLQIGTSSPTNKLDFMNAQEYVKFFRQAAVGAGEYDYRIHPSQWSSKQEAVNSYLDDYKTKMENISSGNDWQNNPTNYNWQNQSFQNAYTQQFNLSASGGNKKTTFFAGGGYSNKKGILLTNSYRKFSGRLNLRHQASDKLDFGLRLGISRTLNNRLPASSSFSNPIQASNQPPIVPIFADANPNQPGYQKSIEYNTNTPTANRVDLVNNSKFRTRAFHTLGNVNAEYDIIPNLSFKSRFGLDIIDRNEERYTKPRLMYNTGAAGTGYNAWTEVQNYTNDNFFTYQNNFTSKHNLKVVLGESYNWVMHTFTSTAGENFPSKDFTNIENAAAITSGNSRDTDYRFISYFIRANYNYNDRYLFKVSTRIDGSSRFGKNNRYGIFPAGSVGWVLSDEDFLKNVEDLSLLKLRASYGVTGNANIANFASLGLYNGVSYSGVSGLLPSQTPNPDLKWEKTRQFDIGVDFGFFDQRVNGNIDYYHKKTTDLLLGVNIPGISGFSTQLRNVGKLENHGIEFAINTQNLTGPFIWASSFNISFNRNKVTNLNGQIIKVQSYANRYVNRAIEGEPLGVFKAYEYAGVNPKNGDALFYLNHKPTDTELKNGDVFKVEGRFNNRYVTNNSNFASRTIVGNPNPDFTGGFDNNFSYKGINLDLLLQFVYGNDLYNATYFRRSNGLYELNQLTSQLNAWQKPGDITDVPQARRGFDNGVTAKSTRNLSDGSYLRLKHITLSYQIPLKFLSKINMRQLKVFVTGTNLLTFTNYPGYDPEHSLNFAQSNLNIGNSFFTPPQARTITGGINLKF